MPKNYCLEISGDFACFTRPEMKVERVSYDVITPSSARSVFEAILWKPAIQWQVTKIEVLKRIQWVNLRRNEVGRVFADPTAKQLEGSSTEALGFFIEEERQQRASLFLKDVQYRIYADLVFDEKKDVNSNYAKYTEMFERRAEKGQCFNQPYLGCREFSCDFRLIKHLDNEPQPIQDSQALGWMLYDLNYSHKENPTPYFFNAEMKAGIIQVPASDSKEIRG
jgi:CRISPR-associated protein Cas5d